MPIKAISNLIFVANRQKRQGIISKNRGDTALGEYWGNMRGNHDLQLFYAKNYLLIY